jgi:6-phosphofructokinase 2
MAILTVTLNPALDLETRTERLQPGEKLRCAEPTRDPGGGGINVARAVRQLGGEAVALVAAGGPAGAALADMLAAKSIPAERLPAPGEVRQNLSVIETATGAQYRFIFPGPTWAAADVAAMRAALRARVAPGDWVVLSGSLPPGMPAAAYGDLVAGLSAAGATVLADTSGAALQALVARPDTGLHVLRLDFEESEAMAGHSLPDAAASAAAAADLVARGIAKIAILARGAEGSVLAAEAGTWAAPAADVPVRSRTGAGDSFVAGTVLALSQGRDLPETLSWGCAAASAAVTTAATELCDAETFARLLPLSSARKL